jgi:Carboxypeptidase regulatory-like domain
MTRFGFVLRIVMALLVLLSTLAVGQSTTASILGNVTDQSGAAVAGATVTVTNMGTGLQRITQTDASGNYVVPTLPVGNYKVEAKSPGLQTQLANNVELQVNQNSVQNFSLKVAQASEVITIEGTAPVIESTTMTVGQVIDNRTTQEIPLNGRHFVDLAQLAPGTVVPPANGFLTAPLRGQGSFGVVTAGNREDTTNFMINGINLNDMANGQITFQPTINTVAEFKIDNSTPSAEYGRNSGSTVNIATRSGSNEFHGEAFEFIRNEDLDARNFFNKEVDTTGVKQPKNAFKRNQFGGALGGPIWKNHTFFFGSYEGLRQRQGVALSSQVPSSAQRATVTNSTVQKLLALVPQGVGGDANNPASFTGAAVAPVNIDQGTGDVSHNFSDKDRLHGYYVFQRDQRKEVNIANPQQTVPGAGDTRQSHRQIFTLNETHVFTPNVVNDFRAGFNRIHITFVTDVQNAGLDPSAFGINNGLTGPVGIPQIFVGTATSAQLVFGGERNFPQGRGDLTSVISDSVSYLRGSHSFKFGGEYRRFNGNSILADEGQLGFASFSTFLAGQPNAFIINLGGNHPARTTQQATGLFAMDSYKVKPYLTLEYGLRWEWNFTPTEAQNRSTVFLQDKLWLAQLGSNGVSEEYHQNNKLFQPRVGLAWDLFHNGKTVLRGGYGLAYDQPLPIISSNNPPFGIPVSFTSTPTKPVTSFANLLTDAAGSGLVITSANRNYDDSYTQSWNLNLQQELAPSLAMMIGYFGSKGTHLNSQININQLVPTATPGVYARPYPNLAADSPIHPTDAAGRPLNALGNITSNESIGTSNYNALWVTGTKHMTKGLLFNANYTWSKSMDINSRNFQGVQAQNNLNPFADRALSDFDARHHFTFSTIYGLPFGSNRFAGGWRLGTIVILQSGNPINITAGNPGAGTGITGFTGNGTIRPDLIGPLPSVGKTMITSGPNAGTIQWFSANVCDVSAPNRCPAGSNFGLPLTVVGGRNVFHFGSLGRNAMTGPDFKNVDFSISKTTKITERLRHELRIEAFDLFNHPNFSNPNLSAVFAAANPSFGVIRSTRNPTGDAGSSRQFQIAMKLLF